MDLHEKIKELDDMILAKNAEIAELGQRLRDCEQIISDLEREIGENTYFCERCEEVKYGPPAHSQNNDTEFTCHPCLKELKEDDDLAGLEGEN